MTSQKPKQLALLVTAGSAAEVQEMLTQHVVFGPIGATVTQISDSTYYVLLSATVAEQAIASVVKTFIDFQKQFEESKTTTVTLEQIANFGKSDSDPTKKNWQIPWKEFEPKSKFLVQVL